MKKKKKQFTGLLASRFYRVYFIAVSVALIAIAIGLIWLRSVVKDYETAQPVHAAEVVAELFERGDYKELYAFDTSARDIYGGDQAFYVDSMNQVTAGRSIAWREAFSSNPNEKKYTVTLDGEKFASFTLVPSGQTTAHGNKLWQLGSVTTNVTMQAAEEPSAAQDAPYRVTAPSDCAVTVNGRTLTEADIVTPARSIYPEDFLPKGVTGPMLVEYGFTSEEGEPQVSVTDAGGASLPVKAGEDGFSFSCDVPEDAAIREQFQDPVLKLAERIAKYTVDDLKRDRIGIASDSPAETILKKFSNSWAPSHKSTRVVNPQVSEVRILSDSCLTCHVSFDFVLTSRRENDYTYPTSYTLCIIKRKGKAALYNIIFH